MEPEFPFEDFSFLVLGGCGGGGRDYSVPCPYNCRGKNVCESPREGHSLTHLHFKSLFKMGDTYKSSLSRFGIPALTGVSQALPAPESPKCLNEASAAPFLARQKCSKRSPKSLWSLKTVFFLSFQRLFRDCHSDHNFYRPSKK